MKSKIKLDENTHTFFKNLPDSLKLKNQDMIIRMSNLLKTDDYKFAAKFKAIVDAKNISFKDKCDKLDQLNEEY